MKITKTLAEFLAEEGALTLYIENVLNIELTELGPPRNQPHSNLYECGFAWSESPEGGLFWEKLHDKFVSKFLNSIKYRGTISTGPR